ncbi:PREDICTED: plasmolipin-like isoform X2 [Priapulus caudatus]|uniref:Plasmolipin-like isoform X2 n=1 Tax=Priapulus caudatus TaxID=37621 RepID=A0ABM1ELR5_PRICU|nr:PREDICTED: plasmolipin-like isoform X2 [Priapulus caudatus]
MSGVGVHFAPDCIPTRHGIAKLFQLGTTLLAFICVQVANYPYFAAAKYFLYLSVMTLIVTGLLGFLYLLFIPGTYRLPWEMVYCGIVTVMFLVGSGILATNASYSAALGAGSFFGFSAMLAYGVDAVIKFMCWRSGETTQCAAAGPGRGGAATTSSPSHA